MREVKPEKMKPDDDNIKPTNKTPKFGVAAEVALGREQETTQNSTLPEIKEVWFPGTHSDM